VLNVTPTERGALPTERGARHPAQVLLDAAEGADLLVVGSRGHGHGRPAA
jgi:nucleotide-binding universal stress UspA family protein